MPNPPPTGRAEFEKLLSWAYRGEVSGAALFTELAARFDAAGRQSDLRTLTELEEAMKRVLSPLLAKHGVSGGDEARSRRDARNAAEVIASGSWNDFLAMFEPTTNEALERYRRLASLAPASDLEVLQLLIQHELTLREYGRRQRTGDVDDALELVRTTLADLREHATAQRSGEPRSPS